MNTPVPAPTDSLRASTCRLQRWMPLCRHGAGGTSRQGADLSLSGRPRLRVAIAVDVTATVLLPFEFALTYANRYFVARKTPGGLTFFPGIDVHADDDTAPG